MNSYEEFGIPLETIWNDIDYMKQYRDFDNDPIRFGYSEGKQFLQRLHDSGRHYIPIIDGKQSQDPLLALIRRCYPTKAPEALVTPVICLLQDRHRICFHDLASAMLTLVSGNLPSGSKQRKRCISAV